MKPAVAVRDIELGASYRRIPGASRISDVERFRLYRHLDAAQLFKHAFALRTAVHRRNEIRRLTPILFYVYAEPERWPVTGKPVDVRAKIRHRDEIEHFKAAVDRDEVAFVSCSYKHLLDAWKDHEDSSIRVHADALITCFAP